MSLPLSFLFSVLFSLCCATTKSDSHTPSLLGWENPAQIILPYRLSSPNFTYELEDKLREISGLSMTANYKHLVTHNDEDGIIFILNKESGEIIKEIIFWKEGDYEGIEVVGNDAYVVKSNGNIYKIENYLSGTINTTKFDTPLTKSDNVEGLAYEASSGRLLLAAKGDATVGKSSSSRRKIYGVDLKTMKMISLPLYIVSAEVAVRFINRVSKKTEREELLTAFKPSMNFNPSALAIHPLSKELYLLSSTAKMLIVLNAEGQIVLIKALDKKMHAQPEGICFDKDGTLYISNEGRNSSARIYKYVYRN